MKSKNLRSLVLRSGLFAALSLILTLASTAKSETLTGDDESECFGPDVTGPIVKVFGKFPLKPDGSICQSEDPAGYRHMQILTTIQNLQFTSPNVASGDDFVTPRFGFDWIAYIHEKTNAIRREPFDCEEGTAGIASGGEIHLCMPYFNPKEMSIIPAIDTLMHEAAHLHSHVSHVKCRVASEFQGSGRFACDDTMNDGGAYAVSVEVKAKLATRVLNISPVLKEAARSEAILTALTRINNPPNFKRVVKPLILSSTGELGIYHNDSYVTIQKNVSKGVLARGWADDYYYIRTSSPQAIIRFANARHVYAYPKNALPQLSALKMLKGDLSGIRGVHLGDNIQIVISKNSAEVICRADKPGATFENAPTHKTFNFKHPDNPQLIYLDGYDQASQSVTVRTDSKTWTVFSCDSEGNFSYSASGANAAQYGKVMEIGNEIFAIDKNGRFGKLSAENKVLKLNPILRTPVYDMIEMVDYVYFNDDGSISTDDFPTVYKNM